MNFNRKNFCENFWVFIFCELLCVSTGILGWNFEGRVEILKYFLFIHQGHHLVSEKERKDADEKFVFFTPSRDTVSKFKELPPQNVDNFMSWAKIEVLRTPYSIYKGL